MTVENNDLGSDIPRSATSSVGTVAWPPIEANEERSRGILDCVIESTSHLNRVIDQFSKLEFSKRISRHSGRIFVTTRALEQGIINNQLIDSLIEGIIPLEGCGSQELEDTCLVYLGKNTPERTPSHKTMDKELEDARRIFRGPVSRTIHCHDNFEFQLITDAMRQNADIQIQFYDLYSIFGWNQQNVINLLKNPNNLLMGVFNDGLLVSTGMAEQATIKLKRKSKEIIFRMDEITEAATREEFRGNGLYTTVAIKINQILSNTNTNLVYAESNLSAPAVLKAAHRQGRHSVLNTFTKFGITPKPLRQPIKILGGSNDSRPTYEKNDLLVTYLTRSELLKRYGK